MNNAKCELYSHNIRTKKVCTIVLYVRNVWYNLFIITCFQQQLSSTNGIQSIYYRKLRRQLENQTKCNMCVRVCV